MKLFFRQFVILGFMFIIPDCFVFSQVSINTDSSLPDNSAMLDVKSTAKGVLLPRMTLAQRNAITSPAAGLTIFQTDNTPGIYFNSGTSGSPLWVMAGNGSFWSLTGNAGATVGTNFLGSTDGQPLMFKVNNQKAGYIDFNGTKANTGFGYQTLNSITTGNYNTANGYQALYSGNTGSRNTANGSLALYSNNFGYYNTANGFAALYSNTEGHYNTANGYAALYSNTTGNVNTANGQGALYYNTTGNNNTANGYGALNSNTTANQNTAIGNSALLTQSYNNSNTPWNSDNVAVGYEALYSNQPTSTANGINNTAVGNYALHANDTGADNTAIGFNALILNTTGSYNTGVGFGAFPIIDPINNWTGLGYNVGSAISIGNSVEIGNTAVTSIKGQVAFSTYSDGRIKDNVVANVPGLDFIKKLRPVTYNLNIHRQNEMMYKGKKEDSDWPGKYDIEKIRMTGFVAQEVEQAAKECGYDFSGVEKPQTADGLYGLRYSEFVVPLVKAVQELSSQNEAQQLAIEELKSQNEQLLLRLEKLDTK